MSNTVPDGWEYRQLGDYIIDSAAGEWGNEAQGDDNDIPVLRSTNFTKSGVIDYTKLAFRNIEKRKRIKKALKNGDILLEKSGGSPTQPVGRVVYFDRDTPHLYSNFTQKLVPAENCHNKYLFYKLYFEYQNGTVLKFQQQTTGIINFQLAEYLGFKTTFAPLPEQQKIATILSSVDDVIEKTRAQIDKLIDLKIGMMQELLTKGIGHTEFKDSPVGRIPASWEIKTLGELADFWSGYAFKSHELSEQGLKVVRISNLHKPNFPYWKYDGQYKDKWIVENGDVLFSWAGVANSINVHKYAGERALLNQHIYNFKFQSEELKLWTYQILKSLLPHLKASIEGGAGQLHLTKSFIQSISIPLPPKEERSEITGMLEAIDSKIGLVNAKEQRLSSLKKSLMQDLLTGKVRVKIDQKESAVA